MDRRVKVTTEMSDQRVKEEQRVAGARFARQNVRPTIGLLIHNIFAKMQK
jgi:hypothetical protein